MLGAYAGFGNLRFVGLKGPRLPGRREGDHPLNRSNRAPVSVLTPTREEEEKVAECVKSVSWADEVL
jgi:hypothetical protein